MSKNRRKHHSAEQIVKKLRGAETMLTTDNSCGGFGEGDLRILSHSCQGFTRQAPVESHLEQPTRHRSTFASH